MSIRPIFSSNERLHDVVSTHTASMWYELNILPILKVSLVSRPSRFSFSLQITFTIIHRSRRASICLQPYTVNLKLTILRSLECPCVLSRWRLRPECSVDDLKRKRRLKLKHTWQLNWGLYSYGPSTAGCSQRCKLCTMIEVASGKVRA